MGHMLMENGNGLVVNAMVAQADGRADREAAKAMIADARQVTPHVAQNTSGRASAMPDEIVASEGYAMSLQKLKCTEQGFEWGKLIGPIRQVMVRGIKIVDQLFLMTMTAYNLVRMLALGQVRREVAQ